MPQSSDRIVIIGAGAAGLTVAETLKRKGYTNITILERSDHPGGKCCSLEYQSRFYELGACIVAGTNQAVLALAKQYHVPIAQVDFGASFLLDVATGQALPKKTFSKTLATWWQVLFRYLPAIIKYRRLAQPGLANLDAALALPFTVWAKQRKLELVAAELAPFFTGYGYGYFDEIPVAYVLKYYSWKMIKAFVTRQLYKFPGGIQHLWTEVAKHNNVLYGTVIKKIIRGEKISIVTGTQTLECDALIVTSPLDEFTGLADTSTEEKTLFGKIQYYDYRTYALLLNNFSQPNGYFPGNYTANRLGQPVFWYHRYADSNLYTFYAFANDQMTDEQILNNIGQVIEQLGGTIDSVQTTRRWKFFPHITSQAMQAGYFDQLEKLQGQQATYFAGELMNFSTVGLTAEYAERLVERFF